MSIKLMTDMPDHIIGLEIDGWIDAEDIDRVIKLVEPRIDNGAKRYDPALCEAVSFRTPSGARECVPRKLQIYAEVNSWSGMSLGAFIKDLKFGLQHLSDFEKEAIVSNKPWLESLAALGNKLFSGIEVKHFTLDDKDKALEWLGS